ncbi:MAG TPA: 2,3-bisphosphoglycerate-independent phosphoglycerate mutase [Baekduia sp.]|nr:2,3-bisphosphoglycerate-independent phosphoglycerate mutase [Baekduia sp.]
MAHPCAALVILDGWGLAPAGPGNAVELARTPVFDDLIARYPNTTLQASGGAVGLPDGQMGNSEVGHMNLGAGAIIKQDLTRIDEAVANGELASNAVLRDAFVAGSAVHLVGLVSDGGVHSSMEHLRALIEMGAELKHTEVIVHAFTDGRDTSPTGAARYIAQVQQWCEKAGNARIADIIGRYYAMDRDNRAERTQLALDMLVGGKASHHFDNPVDAVTAAYERDARGDEFIAPTLIGGPGRIAPQDSVIAFNFRPDRMRQLTAALAPTVARYTTMTEYDEEWDWHIAFPPARPEITLSHVIAEHGAKQLHVAETEKYPHVTYFFGGGEETPEPGERREMVPSPRDVPTYDHKPEMSAREAADAFVAAWREDQPGFGIINFANPDMVGHTGVISAAVAAVEAADAQLARIVDVVLESGGVLVITADHGNAEEMLEADGSPDTSHTTNLVPVVVTDESVRLREEGGILGDVAPTILELLGFTKPAAMTGRSLLAP